MGTHDDWGGIGEHGHQCDCVGYLVVVSAGHREDVCEVEGEDCAEEVGVHSDTHVADPEKVEFWHFEPIQMRFLFFLKRDHFIIFISQTDLRHSVDHFSIEGSLLGHDSFKILLFLVADSYKLGFVDNFKEEDGCAEADEKDGVSDDFVLQFFIVHGWEDDESEAEYCKIADEGEQIPQIIEFILSKNIFTLLFREQVREGTKLIWLIWREAQPTLNKLGNMV